MNCLICNNKMSLYITKDSYRSPYEDMTKGMLPCEFCKCDNCGFVVSKTHLELSSEMWEKLNFDFHSTLENDPASKWFGQPPYFEQASMINMLGKNHIINTNNMLDYAGGYGTLSNILSKYYNFNLPVYDPYMQSEDFDNYIKKEQLSKYDLVMCSAMFEHIIKRQDLDNVNNCVSDDGCLIIHTFINEVVPKDSDWFYLNLPVHTAFHTNKSMQILMEQWGYEASLYCPLSKCWVLFKKHKDEIEEKICKINTEFEHQLFFYKKAFLDYWK